MITSLRLYKHVNVGVGSTGKFQIASNNEIFNTKEIPAVRYKFDAYTQDDADFIKKMEETFKHSVHVIEVGLLDAAEVVPMIKETIDNVAIMVYMDINSEHSSSHEIKDEAEIEALEGLRLLPVNRLVLVDNTTDLDYIGLNALNNQVSKLSGIKRVDIGICGSPFTDSESSCMSAALARKWAAKFNRYGDGALPSANHNSDDNNCGCLRFIGVSEDIIPVSSAKSGGSSSDSEKEPKEPKERKPKKNPFPEW